MKVKVMSYRKNLLLSSTLHSYECGSAPMKGEHLYLPNSKTKYKVRERIFHAPRPHGVDVVLYVKAVNDD